MWQNGSRGQRFLISNGPTTRSAGGLLFGKKNELYGGGERTTAQEVPPSGFLTGASIAPSAVHRCCVASRALSPDWDGSYHFHTPQGSRAFPSII